MVALLSETCSPYNDAGPCELVNDNQSRTIRQDTVEVLIDAGSRCASADQEHLLKQVTMISTRGFNTGRQQDRVESADCKLQAI